jgi:hypothetical protein
LNLKKILLHHMIILFNLNLFLKQSDEPLQL